MFELVEELAAKVKVFGIGGAGCNIVNAVMASGISGVECISANTDKAALSKSLAPYKIQTGTELTGGFGAGADPEIGRRAAMESRETIKERLSGANIVFIFAGLGGGTGTGGAPIVADIAKEVGAFTVGIVAMPFEHEGEVRKKQAQQGLEDFVAAADTVLVVRNQKLLDIGGGILSVLDAFKWIDDVICSTIQGLADLINRPGLINADFADVKKILSGKGVSIIRTGSANGQNRAIEAINDALRAEIFDENSLQGARGVLVSITGSPNMGINEINSVLAFIRDRAHEEANIIVGASIDEDAADEFRVTLIAADFDKALFRASKKIVDPLPMSATRGYYKPLFGDDDLSTPAYTRRTEPSKIVKIGVIDDGEYLSYDGADIATT